MNKLFVVYSWVLSLALGVALHYLWVHPNGPICFGPF